MIDPEGSREENVYMAKLAEEAERYDDMLTYINKVLAIAADPQQPELSTEERGLLSLAYNNIFEARRISWCIVSSMEHFDGVAAIDHLPTISAYRTRIESEIEAICESILPLIDSRLISSATSREAKAFYLQMKGDYNRYIAEIKTGEQWLEVTEATNSAYKEATEIVEADLSPAHPTRLALAISFSVFLYEIPDCPHRACKLAKQAFDDAATALDTLGKGQCKKSRNMMKLLEGNLSKWTSDMKEDRSGQVKESAPIPGR
ncbi:14-3-3-like protein 16R isoform X1 [Amborella trichopoda]|uniref:14-3-3 domain-containing protein n=1 Tax=Amborella trichopoda TaxID=13333 RepID=W1NJU8_AMBTC|nr:14-3-3-like protein 16R isoform X1 [Amborella trichopoda]ERM95455.1 hypothetical protein AMTR_s00008p00259210 [Amborella trichopoda]|eukprot:XP_020528931.1 14-3-3-like protein 16R isoform X1 [Amborella trichopoda]